MSRFGREADRGTVQRAGRSGVWHLSTHLLTCLPALTCSTGSTGSGGEKRKREAAPPLVTAERQHEITDGISKGLPTVPVEDLLTPEHKYVALIYGT